MKENELQTLTLLFQGLNNDALAVISLNLTFESYDEELHRKLEKSISQSMHFCGLSEYELELPNATFNITKVKGDGLKFSVTTDEGDVITFANPFLAVSRSL